MSACLKKPVRVIRGDGLKSKYAPAAGFRYDGLYTVSNPRIEMGPKGFNLCKFDFHRCLGQPSVPTTDNPDFYRSDIDIRRKQYREHRAAQAKTTQASGSGSRGSPIDLDGTGSRDTSASLEDEDDEDQEDIFGDIDDVENAMSPVSGYLDEIKNPDTEPHRRKLLLVRVGRYVQSVLQQKRGRGKDEGGRDYDWWYEALWSHVGCAMPTKQLVSVQQVEEWYTKYEQKLQTKKERKEKAA
ncbi:uncharacterized protein PHACADRAFT_263341 [Phanerochaete carnosa HHB-10118-sp]|uniref:YDG domain-containing protein n=1 Tax=Phanerochaete carnosa (strain HHB-10118-sp) TaxID=650164 RepID=K5VJ34_PHACS|nr:uncharacterized protein PHACADRAFT_263341 [Phanerochaete carnosa HHB-10118-sp]EKM51303.1 hypothetical protein PHACADRAFT_263341 [Phanerochaete carnosa HHB-10118-sp]